MGDIICTIGYHKAERSYAEKVKTWKTFKISNKRTEWLGKGIYFWEAKEDADEWCKKEYDHYTIFQAELSCDSNEYKDFDDADNMRELIAFAEACQKEFLKTDKNANGNSFIYKCAACNYYKQIEGVRLMRYSFPKIEINPIGFPVAVPHPQLCATDNDVIRHFGVLEEG